MNKRRQDIGCQQILLHSSQEHKAVLEYLCSQSNKIYNCSVYYARQKWFKSGRIVGRGEICSELARSQNRHFTSMYVSSAQQICNAVAESFKSFQMLLKLWRRGELDSKPSPPKYRKTGMYTVTYPKRWLKLEGGSVRIPLGNKVKAWFGISSIDIPMPTNLNWQAIKEVRILPRNGMFYAEFVYSVESIVNHPNPQRVLGIDHGVDNWLTCVSNVGASFIIDGKHLKSLNQWYNKRVAALKETQPQGFWSSQLSAITEKRNRQMRDAVNKAARLVINHCLEENVGRIIFGWNPRQKEGANMGRKANQMFVSIPTARLKVRLAQLSEQYGIQFVETEEANTSAASFLDDDSLPKYGEKPEGWKSSGRRVKRGLFRTAQNWTLNADCNGAANILRKVAATLGFDLNEVSSGVLTTPLRVRLWTLKNLPALAG